MEQYSQEEVKKKIAELKAQNAYLLAMRKAQQEAERKRREKRVLFDTMFPEFKDVPIIWIVIGIICVLFSLFTMII